MTNPHKVKFTPKLSNPIEIQFKYLTKYHYYIFVLLFIGKFLLFSHILNLLFLSPPMDFYCNDSDYENVTVHSDLKNFCPCQYPEWDTSVFTATVQTKFGIFCSNAWLLSFSQAMFFLGLLVGSLIFGFLSDRYGRLSMFILCCFMIGTFGSLVSVMSNISTFILMRFLEGIGSGGSLVINFVLCIEYCGVKHREMITALFHLPGNLAQISLAGLSYLLRNCDYLQITLSLPLFVVLFYRKLIMESPKWLMDNDYIEEAVAVMQKFCQFNKTSCHNIKEQMVAYHTSHQDKRKGNSKVTFWEIFKHKTLSMYFGCISVNYFVCGMGYYGVTQFIGKMGGNIHANVAISGLLLLPGTIASIFLLKILSRRKFLMATNMLSGIFIITLVSIPAAESNISVLKIALACICNCFFLMSFIIVFLYGVELFPTSIRNSTLGVLSVLSRIGQLVTPAINELPELEAGLTYGIMAILGAVLCYPLPETKNYELPSSLKDIKTLTRKSLELDEYASSNTQIQLDTN